MDVLLTGDLSAMTEEICKQLSGENKVVLASKNIATKKLDKRVATFSFSPNDPMFGKLFRSYSFGAVIFLSTRGEQTKLQQAGSLEDLDTVLRLCDENKVSQMVYVSSTEVYAGNKTIDELTVPVPVSSQGHIQAAGENLCNYYRSNSNLNTIILHVPYVYGLSTPDSFLGRAVVQASQVGKIALPGAYDQACDFVCDSDLATLVGKIIDEGYEFPQGIINVGSGKPTTFGQLFELLKKEMPNLEAAFGAAASSVPPPVKSETARKQYDWVAANDIVVQMHSIVEHYVNSTPVKKNMWQKLKEQAVKHRALLKALELILGFLLMQFLNSLTETSVQFRFVDFRLLYVIIMGSIHGMRTGIIAALLAWASCLLSYASTGLDWKVLVYNIDNWLPFIAYLVAGAVTGYTKDKNTSTLEFEKEQLRSLEERYIFLYDLYDQTLKNKSQYKDQLMSYRDSFGRIYAITQRLDSVVPDAVFQEAAYILEDVLENQNIAIYTVDQNRSFARLAVSSKGLVDKMDHSIRLSEYGVMVDAFTKDDIWCNKELLDKYPAYCAPVYDRDQLVAMIMICKAQYEQMATYYINLIKVLCGLIQASLVRAATYNIAVEGKIFIEGTRILASDRFEEILSIKRKMKEDNLADFKLLRIENRTEDITKLSDLVSQGIRATDTLGRGKDGVIYLILAQAKHDSVDFVLRRLGKLGVKCSVVETLKPSVARLPAYDSVRAWIKRLKTEGASASDAMR